MNLLVFRTIREHKFWLKPTDTKPKGKRQQGVTCLPFSFYKIRGWIVGTPRKDAIAPGIPAATDKTVAFGKEFLLPGTGRGSQTRI